MPARPFVRPAASADDARLAEIAAEGDADTPADYLAFVRREGRLLVMARGATVLGFAGSVPVGSTAMVTDLFVAADARGKGIGRGLLTALLTDAPSRMTCSSRHPAALPLYGSFGLEPRWRVDYLRGTVGVQDGPGSELAAAPWAHDRRSLVDHFARRALVTGDLVVGIAAGVADVRRLQSSDPARVMERLFAALPTGTVVTAKVPEVHPLHAWLVARGFVADEYDTFCATADVEVDPTLACVDPGLW